MASKCRKRDGIMAKISKVKEYAARYLHEVIGMEVTNIAKEIDVTAESIKQALHIDPEGRANIKTASSSTKDSSFIQQTCSKGTKNVTIMTEGAAQLADEAAKAARNTTNTKFDSCIRRSRD